MDDANQIRKEIILLKKGDWRVCKSRTGDSGAQWMMGQAGDRSGSECEREREKEKERKHERV